MTFVLIGVLRVNMQKLFEGHEMFPSSYPFFQSMFRGKRFFSQLMLILKVENNCFKG